MTESEIMKSFEGAIPESAPRHRIAEPPEWLPPPPYVVAYDLETSRPDPKDPATEITEVGVASGPYGRAVYVDFDRAAANPDSLLLQEYDSARFRHSPKIALRAIEDFHDAIFDLSGRQEIIIVGYRNMGFDNVIIARYEKRSLFSRAVAQFARAVDLAVIAKVPAGVSLVDLAALNGVAFPAPGPHHARPDATVTWELYRLLHERRLKVPL